MRSRSVLLLGAGLLAGAAPAAGQTAPRRLVEGAVQAADSAGRLLALRVVRVEGAGYAVGAVAAGAEAWSGAAPIAFAFIETRNDVDSTLTQDVHQPRRPGAEHHSVRRLAAGHLPDEWLTEAPENVLRAALAAADLAAAPGAQFERHALDGVSFTWTGRRALAWFDPATGLLAAVELSPVSAASAAARTIYSRWTRDASGVRYPRQWTVEVAGRPTESFTADRVTLRFGARRSTGR